MWPVVRDGAVWSVCRFVNLSVTVVSPAKTAEPKWDAVSDMDWDGPKKPCVRWGLDPHTWMGNCEGKKGMLGHVQQSSYSKQLSRSRCQFARTRCGAHWRHLANMIHLSVYDCCRCYAALCKITLTTCWCFFCVVFKCIEKRLKDRFVDVTGSLQAAVTTVFICVQQC